jgi:hypothetical protein
MWMHRTSVHPRFMFTDAEVHQVEVTFVGATPSRQIERASGVTDLGVEGQTVRCVVRGSFQPLLDALRGYEVLRLTAIPITDADVPGGASSRGGR